MTPDRFALTVTRPAVGLVTVKVAKPPESVPTSDEATASVSMFTLKVVELSVITVLPNVSFPLTVIMVEPVIERFEGEATSSNDTTGPGVTVIRGEQAVRTQSLAFR
jgi:hypothetical protein